MTKLILPVIHHIDRHTTWEQALIAYKVGAHGVFLISHYNEDKILGPLAQEINKEGWTVNGQKFMIGLNLLNTSWDQAFEEVAQAGLDYLWLDHIGVTSAGATEKAYALKEKKAGTTIEIFGSVAFKYQATEHYPAKAAQIANELGFITTTSGAATGSAPSVEKIRLMSEAANGKLAVASGMTVDNIKDFAPYLSHILVATGVSIDEHHFDPQLLKKFVNNTIA